MPRDKISSAKPVPALQTSASRRARRTGDLLDKAKESAAWNQMLKVVDLSQAFRFWNDHLQLRSGVGNARPLLPEETDCILLQIRAMSWVESRHGRGAGSAKQDPMQCGNPLDAWWKQVSGVIAAGDRLVGGPGKGNYYPSQMPAAFDALLISQPGLASASTDRLTAIVKGHKDTGFNSVMSVIWAIPAILHKTNTPRGKTYQCHPVNLASLVKGAKAYNGGGNPSYAAEVESVLDMLNFTDPVLLTASLPLGATSIAFNAWNPGILSLPYKSRTAQLRSPAGHAHAQIWGFAGGFGLRVPSTGFVLEFTKGVSSVSVDFVAPPGSALSIDVLGSTGKVLFSRRFAGHQIVHYETESAQICALKIASDSEAVIQTIGFESSAKKRASAKMKTARRRTEKGSA